MKIVSLQSVGLGATYTRGDYEVISIPYDIEVGAELTSTQGYGLGVTVTEINHIKPYQSFEYYEAKTSDGHIRVLPADKYIAEWSEYTDRISPDEIGNDIHEFLHGGEIK